MDGTCALVLGLLLGTFLDAAFGDALYAYLRLGLHRTPTPSGFRRTP
jgi:hypothetical protein